MDVSSMKIRDMRKALDSKEISAKELTQEYISKIKVISIVLLLSEKAKIMLKPLKKLQRKIYLRATNLKSLSTNGSTLSLKPLSKKNLFCLGWRLTFRKMIRLRKLFMQKRKILLKVSLMKAFLQVTLMSTFLRQFHIPCR